MPLQLLSYYVNKCILYVYSFTNSHVNRHLSVLTMDPSIRSKRDGYKQYDITDFPDKIILSVRGQNITVSASYLSLHSSFFYKMFYVDKNGNGTVQLDEDPKIFGDLLDFIYPCMKKTNCCVECSDSFLNRLKLGVKLRLRFAVKRLIEGANEKYLPGILQTLAAQKFLLADLKKSIIDRFGSVEDIRKKFPNLTSALFEQTKENEPVVMTNFPDNCLIKLKSSFLQVSASSLSLHSPKMRDLLFSKTAKINHFVEANFEPTSFQLFIDATKGIFPNEYSSSLLNILWELNATDLYEYYKEAMMRDISRWTGDPKRQPNICLLNHLHACRILNLDIFAKITRDACPTTVYMIIRDCPFVKKYFDELINSGQNTPSVLRSTDNPSHNQYEEKRPNGTFEVFVKTLKGKTINCYCRSSDTVEDLKRIIEHKEGTPADQDRVVYAGKQLEDRRTMACYGIKEGATVHLVPRLRGC